MKLGCYYPALVGDGVHRISRLVFTLLVDKSRIEHLVERFGKIEVHNVVVLHNDVVESDVVKRVIYILHKVKHKYLYVSFISDARAHSVLFPPKIM